MTADPMSWDRANLARASPNAPRCACQAASSPPCPTRNWWSNLRSQACYRRQSRARDGRLRRVGSLTSSATSRSPRSWRSSARRWRAVVVRCPRTPRRPGRRPAQHRPPILGPALVADLITEALTRTGSPTDPSSTSRRRIPTGTTKIIALRWHGPARNVP